MRRRLQLPLTLITCGALGLGSVNCGVTPPGPAESAIAKARSAAAPGADAYDRECSSCHGKHGEGLAPAPPTMGPNALARFHNAQDVYDYVSSRMPLPASRAGTLEREAYWAIVNYLLIAQGVAVPAGGVRESNAKAIALR